MKRWEMREYIHAVMMDRKRSFPARLLACLLSLASGVYFLLISLRGMLYRMGIFRARRVETPVVSIGNLTLGGTGKTPFTVMCARLVKGEMARRPAVLIRGYGWDEQAMLRSSLEGIPLLVGRDRVKGARTAIGEHGVDIILLDDGFQHWRIARDLDIVLVDTRNPFGNDSLFPRGILREPLSSIKRAAIVVLTKTDRALFDKDQIKSRLRAVKDDLVFLETVHRATHLWDLETKERIGLDRMKGKRAFLVSGVGDPGYFQDTVKGLGAEIAGHAIYPDHYRYRPSDMRTVFERSEAGDILLTTEKDAIKFEGLKGAAHSPRPIHVVHIEMVIVKGKEEFCARLHSLSRR